jgi:hypothetical protein
VHPRVDLRRERQTVIQLDNRSDKV